MFRVEKTDVARHAADQVEVPRDQACLHVGPEQIAENVDAVLKRVIGKLEKGKMNIDSAYVKTTMGPSERLI